MILDPDMYDSDADYEAALEAAANGVNPIGEDNGREDSWVDLSFESRCESGE